MFPTTAVPSLLQKLLPTGLAATQFINDLTIIRFAELQTFIEGTVPRPAAPLPATNGWGSTLAPAHAVLHPLVAARAVAPPAHHRVGAGGRRASCRLAISTNRGAWLSIGLGLIYFAVRRARQGDARPLFAVVARRHARGDGGDR